MTIEEIIKELYFFADKLRNGIFGNRVGALYEAITKLRTHPEALEDRGEVSDGYHTFNELYHHRAVLFSVICNDHPNLAWKSKLHADGSMFDGMFIVGIETPDGPATYHYYLDPYWDMFNVLELERAPEWDGHTPAQAIERIGRLATQPNEPLTPDDLRGMVGTWVWVTVHYEHCDCSGWALICTGALMGFLDQTLHIDDCGTKFDAYRHPPKEGENHGK